MQAVQMKTDRAEFASEAGRHRRELLVYCYRMAGTMDEAEDLVQETYLRAWRSYDTFEGRSTLRTYLYRIATNVCLTYLDRRTRRAMPSDLAETGPAEWIQPLPADPADVVATRTGVQLAFIAALQHLPPIRRAVLLLRDVLAWRAAEVADALDTTPTAVNSALLRARAQIAEAAPAADTLAEPPEPQRRALLDSYVSAFQDADMTTLVRLMRADIALEMPPEPQWFRGRTAVADFFGTHVLRRPGEFRMVPTIANEQPAFAAYRRDDDGVYRPHAVHVLTLDGVGIARIAVFRDPATCARFMG